MDLFRNPLTRPAVAFALAVWPISLAAEPVAPFTASKSEAASAADEAAALLERLRTPDLENWEAVERNLTRLWSKSGSDTADLLLQRGRDAVEAEELGEAVEHFSALIDHFPEFAEGWNARASVLFSQEKYGQALQDAARAVELNPNHFGALSGLGIMFERMGDDKNALEAFDRAMAVNPHRARVKEAVDRLRRKLGRATL